MNNLPQICFRYFKVGQNPVTGSDDSEWQCMASFHFAIGKEEFRDGDIFNLSEREDVPYILQKPYISMDDLAEECKDC